MRMTESQRVGGGLNSVLFFNFSREDLGRSAAKCICSNRGKYLSIVIDTSVCNLPLFDLCFPLV